MPWYKFCKRSTIDEASEEGPSTSTGDDNRLRYEAPEELLTFVIGSSWSRWRVTVMLVFCVIMIFYGLNLHTPTLLVPEHLNFSCDEDKQIKIHRNSCYGANGSVCQKFKFSRAYGYTLTEKWNLVCHKRRYITVSNIVFKCGLAIGFMVLGYSADRWGRKRILFVSLILQPCTGILVTTSGTFTFFTVSRFLYGFFISGTALVAIILACEISSNKWRTFNLGILCVSIATGHMLLPFLWMIFADSMKNVLLMSVPQIVLILFIGIIKDSPNWFLCKNQTTEAETVLIAVVNFDGLRMPDSFRIRPVQITNLRNSRSVPLLAMMLPATTLWVVMALNILLILTSFTSGLVMEHILYENENLITVIKLLGVGGIVAASLSTGLCYVIRHKIVIALSSILACFTTIIWYITHGPLKPCKPLDFVPPLIAYGFFNTACFTVWNILPRIFPTEVRGHGIGLAIAFGELSSMVARLVSSKVYLTLPIFLTTFCGSTCIILLCCLEIYSVHNRELPDVLEDSINFKSAHKPVRWTSIRATSPTIDETEVKVTDFERGTSMVADNAFYSPVSRKKKAKS